MRHVEDKAFQISAREYYNLLDALESLTQRVLLTAKPTMCGNSRPVDHECIYDEHGLCFECDAPKK